MALVLLVSYSVGLAAAGLMLLPFLSREPTAVATDRQSAYLAVVRPDLSVQEYVAARTIQ